MKKIFPLIIFSMLSTVLFAQDAKPLKKFMLTDLPLNNNLNQWSLAPQMNLSGTGTRAVTSVQLGTAGNALTTLNAATNCVYADNSLNTVVFIHRNDQTLFGATLSQYRFDKSTDKGLNFTNNIGVLNPTPTNIAGGINARYPQVIIRNPTGNTVADSSWLVYSGAWHNGGTAANNSIWEGLAHGRIKLSGDTTTRTEFYPITNNSNVVIAVSMVTGLPGEYWQIDNEYLGVVDSFIVVYKGVYNTISNDVDWSVYTKLKPNWVTDTTLNSLIAFDPTGQYGWIACGADMTGVGTYQPLFYKTVDGGNIWTGPMVVDLTTFPSVTDKLDATGGIPTAGFDQDLAVDKNGDPHLVSIICSSTGHSMQTGLSLNLYDITYNNATSNWNVLLIDTVYNFRGQIGTSGATAAAYSQDNRPQVSTSPDGSKVAFIWGDSDSTLAGDNIVPDLKGKALDVDTDLFTFTKNFTAGDANWNGLATFHCVSPVAFADATSITVPVVITLLNADGTADSPASFIYFNDIVFNQDEYGASSVKEISNNFATVKIYPNPVNDKVQIYFPTAVKATLEVYNQLGQKLISSDFNNSLSLNTADWSNGIYQLKFIDANGIIIQSQKLVVVHSK